MTMNMTIALVGMPVREAAALTIFIGVAVKGASCKSVAFQPGLALPSASLCIIDMAGIGLAQWSAKAEADLLTLLGGQNALLLLVSTNTSWLDKAQGHGRQMLHCLTKPYGSEDMRAALSRLGAGSAAPSRSEPVAAVMRLAPALAAVRTAAAPVVSQLPLLQSLQALRTMFPDLGRHLLLARLLDLVATDKPQELRLTLHHSIVLHPAQGWVADNAAPGMIERLALDGSAVATMSARELDSDQALQRARHLQLTRCGLDAFLWMLAESSFGQQTPSALRDAELKLRSMPGFTRIPGVGNLSLQLAAICVRLPQTLSSLRAAFPEYDPLEISRFMLLSTVSGLGSLSLVTAAAGVAPRSSPVPRPARRESGGFFRAMLQKLF
ncbi:MAG: hypothetical protein M3R45_08710 [Pseudomonadota bacterium]|nr:hypothetical protein [Pseudomonadota bacterium]